MSLAPLFMVTTSMLGPTKLSRIRYVERNRAGGAIDAVADLNDESIGPGKTGSRSVGDYCPGRDVSRRTASSFEILRVHGSAR